MRINRQKTVKMTNFFSDFIPTNHGDFGLFLSVDGLKSDFQGMSFWPERAGSFQPEVGLWLYVIRDFFFFAPSS